MQQPTADAVQEEIKKLDEFVTKSETQDDKINHVLQFADQLCENNHYAKDKIKEKANLIDERYDQCSLFLISNGFGIVRPYTVT